MFLSSLIEKQKEAFFYLAHTIVVSDGELSVGEHGAFEIEEQSFLNVLCNAFEISENEFVLIENWVRRLIALEQEANAFF